ncbi:MAG: penicillin-binding protein 2 [bacterium]|nr:penicillin-binding protein 2 [bacterium]
MRSRFIFRTRVLCGLFIIVALFLIVRLYVVQIVRGAGYQRDATAQYVAPNPDTGSRGSILFRAKNDELVSAAIMQTGWRIAIKPEDINEPESVYEKLNALTPIDRERFFVNAAKKDDPYEEVAFRVADDVGPKIRAQKIPGVILVQDQWRFYPAGTLAAQTVGFVGFRGATKAGVYGLENEWEETLSQKRSDRYVNPFAEIFMNIEAVASNDPSAHEGSIVTSIEPSVEQQLETTLEAVMKTYSPRLAGGVIMDPHTGEIIAIAAHPTFDPNAYSIVEDPAVFSNPLVENIYEMGSIMKPLTMAVGIDREVVTPSTTYDDTGCIEKSGKKICNYDGKARGVVSMQEVLNQSLNTGASFVVDKIGHTIFGTYVKALELGKKTGVDLPNEATGRIQPIENGYDVDYASASFGQGISVSPIAMTRALSALANGGVLPSPHVVTAIKYQSGITRTIKPEEGPRVFSATSTDTVTRMLVTVFDKALLGGVLKQEHYSIAAKTGTAQIAVSGGYSPDRFLHSFFGYFPAHDPKFIVFLFAVEPHGAEFASATLARPFLEIAKFLINYYNIPPDR